VHIKLARCATTVGEHLTAFLRDQLQLSENQFGVLEALLHLGPLGQREIGGKLLTSAPNVTLLVDALEKRGLVHRERSKEDRRNVIVDLTPAGRKLIAGAFPDHVARLVEAYSALSASEQEELGRLTKKLGLAVKSLHHKDLRDA
jgi:MarR family 2-MHQ and catechol resistance regulon transcriptional repressor